MAKKVKKSLTASQKHKRYRAIQKTTFYGEFVSIATPYVIMGAINFDNWFHRTGGWKIGLGGALALALMSIAVYSITKKKEDKKSKTSGYVKLFLAWLATAFIFILLRDIMDQIAKIMLFGAIGIGGAIGLQYESDKFGNMAELYNEANAELDKEAAKEEVKQERIKKYNEKINKSRRRATE